MTKKLLLTVVLFFAATVLLLHYNQAESEPISIGYIGSITGKYSDLGTSGRNGALLAMEQINALGGIEGRPLQLVIRNDQSLAEKSLLVAKELADRGLKIILGPLASSSAMHLQNFFQTGRALVIGPVIATQYLEKKDDYFIKLFPSTHEIGNQLALEALNGHRITKLAMIADSYNSEYAEPLMTSFAETIHANSAKVVGTFRFDSHAPSQFSELAREVLPSAPQGILFVASPLDTAALVQQFHKESPTLLFFSAPWGISPETVQYGGRGVARLRSVVPYNPNGHEPQFLDFAIRYRERFGVDPTFCAAFNYDAVNMVIEILQRDPEADVGKLKETILALKIFKGLQGDYIIDSNGDAQRPLILLGVVDGKLAALRE